MAVDGTGRIYIPLEDFWKFVSGYFPVKHDGYQLFGVPQVRDNELVIDFAFSSECNPADWAKPPEAVTQWDDLKKKKES